MAARSAFVLMAALVPNYVSALQVTPDSPCASFCLDSNDLDYSDPKSSNTRNKDITCVDAKYQTEPAGRKFQQCLSCLQDSTFVQGSENDQSWFLYNARYSFDYCIFGYPNATGVGSNPCMTSTACGGLEAALTHGELDPAKSEQYSYCDADGGAMLSSEFDKCLACVRAGGEHYYLANYLVALEAGCRQRPEPGKVVGLNDNVFTKGVITIVDPADKVDADEKDGAGLPTTAIVGIVVGVIVALLLAAGCTFIQCRKRRARRGGRGINPELARRARGHRPASSLSFRCQTHLTPKTPNFFSIEEETQSEKYHQPMPPSPSSNSNPWIPYNGISSSPTYFSDEKDALPLTSIKTSLPMVPVKSHSPRHNMSSPQDDYTPTSTTSAAPLLPFRAYVPSEHGVSTPSMGHAATFGTYSSPTSGTTASPLLSQGGWPAPSRQNAAYSDTSPVGDAGRTIPVVVRDLGRPMPRRVTSLGGGSPVESQKIQTSFPPPPPPPPKKR